MPTDGESDGDDTIIETGAGRGEDDPVLAVGATVDRFVILSLIGEGGVGRVYAAYDPDLDRQIALKLRKGTRGPDEAVEVARVRREAQALAKIAHPNVVTVYDVGEHDGQLYVAMEHVVGETLRRWVKSQRPSWREVVDAFIAAAQGLLAVHEAGLVHRDVKPDNIMRSADGRVRVMDFGLARGNVEPQASTEPETNMLWSSTTLTRTGTLAGTPAYMAPEQHLGLPLDARSDQFALCVSLWELLYGERPFEGNNIAALAYNMTHGARRSAPANNSVPTWVRRAIERGLSVDADQRHPSLAALIDALRQDPAAHRRRQLGIAGVVLLSVGLVSWLGWLSSNRTAHVPAPPCAEVETFDAVWNPSRSPTELAQAFARSGSLLASSSAEPVARGLDAWAREWNAARRDACEATHVRHEQSEALMDARIACLDRRRARVTGIIEAFMEADAELVREAPSIVGKLERLDACSDAERLLAATPPPADAETAMRVASLSLRIESLAALGDTGRTESLLADARALAVEADATGHAPLRVDAALLVADIEEYELDPAASLETTRRAYFLALQEDLIAQAALAAVEMMWRTSTSDPVSPTLAIWSDHARVLVQRVEPNGTLEARRLVNEGIIAWSRGDLPLGIEHTRAAIEIAERTVGPRTALVADYRNNLGYMSLLLGDEAEAQRQFEFSMAVWSETLGPGHPRLAVARLSLAEIAIEQARFADARELAEGALQLDLAAGETDGPNVAYAVNVIAELDRREGRVEASRSGYERALALSIASVGPDHWRSALAQAGLGELALLDGDVDEAIEQLGAAERGLEPLGANKRDHARVLFGLARAEAARGNVELARAHAARARERFLEIGRRGERDLEVLDEWLRGLSP